MTNPRIEAFLKMLAADSTNTMVRYGLANEYWKLNEYAQVVEHLSLYLKATDDQGAGYRMLGQALQKLGRLEEARQAFRAGQQAAERHSHPTMAAEIEEMLEMLDE
ncbi:MAG: hypothetical protein K1Y36_28745 [Blastocatellia bacterium]|nr:hypothetical protein [Blastocatellia bacterium]